MLWHVQNFWFILSLFSFIAPSWLVMKIKLLGEQPAHISTSYVMVSPATSFLILSSSLLSMDENLKLLLLNRVELNFPHAKMKWNYSFSDLLEQSGGFFDLTSSSANLLGRRNEFAEQGNSSWKVSTKAKQNSHCSHLWAQDNTFLFFFIEKCK